MPVTWPIAPLSPVALNAAEALAAEARVGEPATTATPAAAQGVPPQTPATVPLPATPAEAVVLAKAQAVTRQGGLAPLMADLAAALTSPDLPAAARVAIEQVLALRAPLTPNVTAPEIKAALDRSGIFLEAKLADPQRAGEARPRSDMKAALLVLREVMQAVAGPGAHAPSATPAPPPPFRGGTTKGEAPSLPSMPMGAEAEVVMPRVKQETEGALARLTLLQNASLPDGPEARAATTPPQWMFEVPFLTPQGAAVAQFEVSRDPKRPGVSAQEAVWRARFSVDVEPMGPVHAQVAVTGGAAQVALWAERGETAERLRTSVGQLSSALERDGLAPQVTVRTGSPAQAPVPAAGHFLDRAL